jgi:hypothetical protein
MSDDNEGAANQRHYARFLTEMELVLSEPGGAELDGKATAHDVSAAGFRATTRAEVQEGQDVAFELVVEEGERVRGLARIVWVNPDQYGWFSAGAKITKLSWRDSSRLRSSVYTPGYDFVALARRMFWAFYWVIVVAAIQNVIFHQATARTIVWKLLPVVGALVVLGGSLFALLG